MKYATISDLIDRFGGRELAEVLDSVDIQDFVLSADMFDEENPDAMYRELTAALDSAQAIVESSVRAAYKTPLTYDGDELESPPDLLTAITCDIARYYLHDDKAVTDGSIDPVMRRYQDAIKQVEEIRKGNLDIPADRLYAQDETVYHI
jgi:phage gp36-like protein